MSITKAIPTVLRKYATFRGVAPRSEYWWWFLATTVVSQGLSLLNKSVSPDQANPTAAGVVVSFVIIAVSLGTFIPTLAVTVRRFHDAGFSGKWLLLYIIPLVSIVLVASTAIPIVIALTDLTLTQGEQAQILFALFAVAAGPAVLSFAVWAFTFVVTLLPSKSAEAGNKHTK